MAASSPSGGVFPPPPLPLPIPRQPAVASRHPSSCVQTPAALHLEGPMHAMQAKVVKNRKVRYAVVGAGWISQAEFMPGVEHTGNSELAALVTGHEEKAAKLGEKY